MQMLCRAQNDSSYKISAVRLESSTEVEVPFAKAQADDYTLGKVYNWLISQNRYQRSELFGEPTDLIG